MNSRWVALLRALNLGRRRITNEALTEAFVNMGFDPVHTFLASGNVVLGSDATSARLETIIADGLEASLGYAVPAFVRSAAEVMAIAVEAPFAGAKGRDGGKPQVAFLRTAPKSAAMREVEALATEEDQLLFSGRELYWLPAGGISKSELDLDRVGRLVGPMTIRTHNTVARLAKKFLSGSP